MKGSASSSNSRQPAAPAAAAQLAPGFRFHPTDEELVSYYLRRKVAGKALRIDAIAEIDLYKFEPWDLPPLSRIVSRDLEWYFFSPLDRKYSNRSRMNRSTAQGYWKTTGKDRLVRHNNRVVGMKKTLVYHAGRAPRGERTNWVMHEYRLEDQELAGTVSSIGIPQDAYVVCRIFKKNGPGPQNGAQYGAPFNDEEWEEADGGMIVLRDDGDEDFYDAGEQGQEYLQMNDFLQDQYPDNEHANASDFVVSPNLQDSGSHQEDPSILLEEILTDPSFSNDMVEHTDEPGLQNGPVLSNDLGKKIGMADWSPPSQNEGYVELNDLAHTVNTEDPPSEDSVGCSLRTCNVDGVDDSINVREILQGEEFFGAVNENINQQELFQMSPTLCDNYNLQLIELENLLAGDCPSVQPAEGNTMFYDAATNDLAYAQDHLAERNHLLDLPTSDPSGFDTVDDLMTYFDPRDDNLRVDSAGLLETSGCINSSILDRFNLTPEFDGINAQPNKVIPRASEANIASGPSSYLRLPDAGYQLKTENDVNSKLDVQSSESNGKSITKRLANMLGSISAPPAIAAEYPVRKSEKPVGQISENHSASSIRVTAGMIQIHGLTVTGSTEHWSLQKTGDVGILLSYSMAGNEVRKSIGFEPISKMHGGAVSAVLRGGFYLFFLWALILIVSYRVGLCVCSR